MRPGCGLVICLALLLTAAAGRIYGQGADQKILDQFRAAAAKGGSAGRGKVVFQSRAAACSKCHILSGMERKAGPKLGTVGDKFTREQLMTAVLEPSARLHPDYTTTTVVTTAGKTVSGV
ncbi:MAG: hypothetical protein VB858_05855, partial [Planctomycetaceae bacterium]